MPNTINNQAQTTYQFSGSSDTNTVVSNENSIVLEDPQGLDIVKTANPSTFLAGDIISYNVRITNNTSTFLTGVRIIDDLGGGNLAYVVGSGSLNTLSTTYPVSPVATNPLTFTLQELNPGQSMTLSYRSQVIFNLPGTVSSITNNVRGIGYTSTGTVEGFASSTIQKKNSVGMSITKSSSVTDVLPNEPFSYFITLNNNGSVSSSILNVTDQLPTNFVLTGVTLRIGSNSPITLSPSDYTLSSGNEIVIPSSSGPSITIPAGSIGVITLTGYFS